MHLPRGGKWNRTQESVWDPRMTPAPSAALSGNLSQGRRSECPLCVDEQLLLSPQHLGEPDSGVVCLTLLCLWTWRVWEQKEPQEGFLSASVCGVDLVVLFSCWEGTATVCKKSRPGGWGRQNRSLSALCTFLGPVVSPVLASISVCLRDPPALQGNTRGLEKPHPALASVSSDLMTCICRLETGKQSIDVCANFRFPPQPASPCDFYLCMMCAV